MNSRICYHCFSEIGSSSGPCPHCGYDPARDVGRFPLALAPGSILNGRYIVGRALGQGGFGITYIAQDVQTKSQVAIKEYFPETLVTRTAGHNVTAFSGQRTENFAYGKQCFLAEAQTLAQFIGTRNIVRVHSYFEENGTAYFAMDYVEGVSLKDYLRQRGGRIRWEEATAILLPVMDALSVVHSKGIIHRDIAPDNIYISKDGTVKLLDFGAARYSLGDRSRSLDVVLKAGYAPKEQYTRRGRQGPYTDVYSLAATFYFCITGKIPPESVDRTDSDEDELILPSALHVKIPVEAEDALEKALAVRAQDRFQTMAEFRAALTGSIGEERARREQERLERERLEQERLAQECLERERFERERLERERQERERYEKERLERERLERERLEKESLERARQEQERLEKERLEQEYLEQERLEKERLERERQEQERLERERQEKERREQERLEKERLKQERLEKKQNKTAENQDQAEEKEERKPLPVKFIAAGTAAVAVLAISGFLLLGGNKAPDAAPTEIPSEAQVQVLPGIQAQSLAAGSQFTVGLRADGTVEAAGYNGYGQCDVAYWQDIASVSAGWQHTLGLRSSGKPVAAGDNQYGQCQVYDWENVVAIAAGGGHSVGLTSDGTVLTAGDNSCGQCDTAQWQKITAIAAGTWHTVGLQEDGAVVAAGDNGSGQCAVSQWKHITAVSAGLAHTVGLRSDGRVVAAGSNEYGQCDVSEWTDIVAVAAGWHHTVGLKADGTVVSTLTEGTLADAGQSQVSGWKNVVAIAAGGYHTAGLKADGTVVSTQVTSQLWANSQDQVSDWKKIGAEQ